MSIAYASRSRTFAHSIDSPSPGRGTRHPPPQLMNPVEPPSNFHQAVRPYTKLDMASILWPSYRITITFTLTWS
ncbi:hypothetical protein SAICODRAFT_30840 [Saitoella complicata NRRL Y-17804]|uniref:uncharacterized protein n=1 Tax=Saitoella complicata (strain BCRC 22490 / CBS 7301 / JCM 7358 / NBRC 10748 / NRRL Y-17804) TaxID=698492 RepID=UPI00086689E1|nr:uncharacterized protein SAICODRAFT_30840 [Saitoella complicata NRRL Y-17804]ODQ52424.1 hypothetical protein SAICODRAFT_30840 [Saitoella complicata NRRL Y-17804]